jgi:thiol:disulfide interchange protein
MVFHVAFRLLLCLAVVMGTYNPSGHSYLHWAVDGMNTAKAAVGVILASIWVFLFWVVSGSLGVKGMIAGLAVAGLGGHQVYRLAGSEGAARPVVEMIALVAFAAFLGIGTSWPALMTRLSGQVHKRYLSVGNKKKRV